MDKIGRAEYAQLIMTGKVTTEQTPTVEKSYRVAIQTKFHPDTRRISVWSYSNDRKKLYVSWNDALDTADNHALAVQTYVDYMEWSGSWIIGTTPDNTGYVAVWGGNE